MATMQDHGHSSSWMDLSHVVVDKQHQRRDRYGKQEDGEEIIQKLSSVPTKKADGRQSTSRGPGRMQRRCSTDILARENIMALLDELSDSDDDDDDTVNTERLEQMAKEQQLQKQLNRSFNIHDAVAKSKKVNKEPPSKDGGGVENKRGKRPSNPAVDQDFIFAALSRNDLFLDLDLSQERIAEAATRFERARYADGTVILEQGDDDFQSMYWYLIAKGRRHVLIDGRPLPRLGRYGGLTRGKTFGEVSLMREEARSATIVAEGEVVLYQLARRDFLEVIEMTHVLGNNDASKECEYNDEKDTSVEPGRLVGGVVNEADISSASRQSQRQWSQDLTEERSSRYEESMPQLTDMSKEEAGGSSSGLLGSWYDQTSTRMASLMQKGDVAGESAASIAGKSSAMHRASTGGFAQKLFSIVGAGLKEEIGAAHEHERPTHRKTWAGP